MLWVLFHIVRRQGTERIYFTYWMRAWGFFALAFLALAFRYRLLTQGPFNLFLQTERQPLVLVLYAFYQVTKLWGVGLLVAGSLSYLHIRRPGWPTWIVVLAVLGLGTVLVAPTFEGALALQAALVVPLYGYAGWRFLNARRGERSLGRTLTGAMFGLLALVWVLYGASRS